MAWIIDAIAGWLSASFADRIAGNRRPWLFAAAIIAAILLLALLLQATFR